MTLHATDILPEGCDRIFSFVLPASQQNLAYLSAVHSVNTFSSHPGQARFLHGAPTSIVPFFWNVLSQLSAWAAPLQHSHRSSHLLSSERLPLTAVFKRATLPHARQSFSVSLPCIILFCYLFLNVFILETSPIRMVNLPVLLIAIVPAPRTVSGFLKKTFVD